VFNAITTERLVVRRLMPEDAEPLFAYRSDANVKKFQSWQCNSVDECRQFIDGLAGRPDTPDSWFQLGLVHRQTSELIGDCGLHFFESKPRQTEIGITVSPSHQGLGYATEAVKAILSYLFKGLGKHRVFASVDPHNVAVARLFERIGMRKEAHFVESLWVNEQWVDDVIFAILEREWLVEAAPVRVDE
jgi:RimJ/RimL family protein N-acetyltransferase